MFPKISIITPSYNQGEYIEETILSVIEQSYPNLEYIIIDGGSTDNTVGIIKKYEKYISYWVSEKDKGQSDAINKGMQKASGEIVNWLNSDDYYMPNALHHVASVFSDPSVSSYCGRSRVFSNEKEFISQGTDIYKGNLEKTIGWARIDQPETFFRKAVWNKIGFLNESFHYVMDKEWWIRYLLAYGMDGIKKDTTVLVNFRIHDASKTGSQQGKFKQETIDLFYSIAECFGASLYTTFLNEKLRGHSKTIFPPTNVEANPVGIMNYFIFYLFCEAYAMNDRSRINEFREIINPELLSIQDKALFKKLYFRERLIPLPLKKLYNSLKGKISS